MWAATAASNLGDGVALVAAPLLAVSLTRDPVLVSGLAFAQRLPWLLFPLVSGAIADRVDRRLLMAVVACGRAVLIAGLGAAVALDRAGLPLLYAVFFLLGTGETLFDTAASTMPPALVPAEDLPRANARLSGVVVIANHFAGPPLGGALFALMMALPFYFGAAGLGAAALLLLSLPGHFRAERSDSPTSRGILRDIGEGVRWLWRQPLLRTMALTLALLNLVLMAQVSVMALFAREQLGLGPSGFGLLLAAHAGGAVLGSLLAGRVTGWLGAGRTLRFGLFIEAGTPALIALSHGPWLAGAAMAAFGFHALVWDSVLISLRQRLTPDALRGRVSGAYRMLISGAATPGTLLGGLLAAQLGLAAPLWLNAIVAAAVIPVVWRQFGLAGSR